MNEKDEETVPAGTAEAAPEEAGTVPPAAPAPEPPGPETAPGTEVIETPDAEAAMRRLSRRSFLWAGAATAGAVGGLAAFNKYGADEGTGIKRLFRRTHEFNEAVARRVAFPPTRRDWEFARARAVTPRNNYHGVTPTVDADAWRLNLLGLPDGGGAAKALTLADLKALPEVSQTTELKCVEGWSAVVNWTGARFADLAARYPPPPGTRYVAMRSEPVGFVEAWYYVGLDLESCLHPQTLLAYAMNGQPLDAAHGAPLRLVMPHKYGIKNIKLITTIAYAADRPDDFWAERGYDYYAGL